jgi:serine/threonine-protein kinase
MGQVYQATDTRLHRTVAVKVLPPMFGKDPLQRARFEREAHAIAGLKHSNICTLHDVGHHEGIDFLVLEYLEGETLASRLTRGLLPFEQALGCAIEIAGALEAAHCKGVIHRDLKPANIFLVHDHPSAAPIVKLLDFGLAKPSVQPLTADARTDMPVTAQGTILGTIQYMAPEQLEARETDARTDIFAFGAVVYELFTGRKAFEGTTQASVIGAIMHADPPPVSQLQRLSPAGLDHVVATCLAKDPNDRWQTMRDLLRELKRVSLGDGRGKLRVARRRLAYAAVVLSTGGALATWATVRSMTRPLLPVTVSMINLPPNEQFSFTGRHVLALSPDGRRVVYAAGQRLYLRSLDSLVATPIEGSGVPEATANALGGTGGGPGGARNPFFSPDGEWIGFWHEGQLKRVSVAGGAPITICAASIPWGVSWSEDGTIWYGQGSDGIWRVSGTGGDGEQVVQLQADEQAHHPQLLPDSDTLLFTLARGNFWDSGHIVAQSLRTGERTVLLRGGTDARYVPTGHLVYVSQGRLLAVPFDLNARRVTGGAVAMADGIAQSANGVTGAGQFAVSRDGTLMYVSTGAIEGLNLPRDLMWIDRSGREERVDIPPKPYIYPRLSPDGSRVALEVRNDSGVNGQIWVTDLRRVSLTRLTHEAVFNRVPLWLDGRRLVFNSTPTGANSGELVVRAADGSTAIEQLTPGATSPAKWPTGMSHDGTRLIFAEDSGGISNRDLMVLTLTGDRRIERLVNTPASESNGVVSPNGRWLAFESNASGLFEVYVRPFSRGSSAEWQISSGGGMQPLWSRDGRELFYLTLTGTLMSVSVDDATTWRTSRTVEVLKDIYPGIGGFRSYDVSLDGKRFLVLREHLASGSLAPARGIVVVQNWFTELNRRAPTP